MRITFLSLAHPCCLRGARYFLLYVSPHNLFLAVGCGTGNIPWVWGIAAAVLLDVLAALAAARLSFPCMCAWIPFRLLTKAWIRFRRGRTAREGPLVYRNRGWEYENEDWFIRVNERSACILFGPEIDFSKPALHSAATVYDPSMQRRIAAKEVFDIYEFSLRDGSSLSICVDQAAAMLEWIGRHGGRARLAG